MSRSVAVLVLLAALAPRSGAGEPEEPSCVTHCHGEQATAHASGVHAGIATCVDCHGGDPSAHRDKEASHAADKGYKGVLARAAVPEMCGSCHADPIRMYTYGLPTDQWAHYKVSAHGKAIARGDERAAVCIDCHGTHGILAVADPRAPTARENLPETCGRCHSDAGLMKDVGLAADVVDRFRDSVHGRALLREHARGAPSCADCHGAHGATPPGVEEVAHVCGRCHLNTAEHYAGSPHAGSPDMRCGACHQAREEIPQGFGECAACHGAHAIGEAGGWMYEGDDVGHCGHCHREDGAPGAFVAAVLEGRTELEHAMAETRRRIEEARDAGVFLEHEELHLLEAERSLVALRPLVHAMDAQAVEAAIGDGLEQQERTREAIGKKRRVLRDRRLLVAGFAGILALLAALVAVKLDALRRRS